MDEYTSEGPRAVFGKFKFRPIACSCHTRPVTDVKYNRDGDLFFSCAKDGSCAVWYTENGERLGTYDNHNGSIWGLDVNWDSTRLLTGASDNSACLWDVETGALLNKMSFPAPVRSTGFAHGDKEFFCVMDNLMMQEAQIMIFDAKVMKSESATSESAIDSIRNGSKKLIRALWGANNTEIYACGDESTIGLWDRHKGKKVAEARGHTKSVSNIVLSWDYSMLVSASADFTAILWDRKTLEKKKQFTTTRPVNAVAISPTDPWVIVGGGQEAMDVTTTAAAAGKFESRFFHTIFEEEIGAVKGHFGPVNTLAYAPDGKSFISGAEDGFVRIHSLKNEI